MLKHPVRPSLQEYKELAAKTPEITINFSLSPGESQPYPADNMNAVRPDVVQIRAYLACELVGWLAPINLIMTRLLPRLDSAGIVGTSDLSYRYWSLVLEYFLIARSSGWDNGTRFTRCRPC